MGSHRRAFALILVVAGCDEAPTPELGDGRDDPIVLDGKADGLDGATPAEIAAVLQLASTADFATLDDDVALDVRAVEGIVAHREGPGGAFDDVVELDAVPWVGPVAFGKMLAWVRDHAPSGEPPCVLISEYIEGKVTTNKGIELYNCGDAPVDLSEIAICLVRDDHTDCELSSLLAPVMLQPGDVYTTCKTNVVTNPQFNNPNVYLANGCQESLGSTMNYSGDDRMLVLHDPSDTGSVHTATVLDALGRIDFRPWWSPWNDIGLRRCTAERNPGTIFFDEADWFVESPFWSDMSDWGVAPTFSCD